VTSLRRRVALWLLPPLLILMVINAVLAYRTALAAVNEAYDRSLVASIRAIAERTFAAQGQVQVDVPYFAFEMFEDSAQERIFYAVIGPDGELLTGYPDLMPAKVPRRPGELLVVDTAYRGDQVRVAAMRKQLYDPAIGGSGDVLIAFAETTESRTRLARDLFYDNLRRQLVLVAVGSLLLVLALTSAFRPLLALRDAMSRRPEDDLTPVPDTNVASEVRPLIDAVNHHMTRLKAMLQARKRFLADAAHQIRTPLAVLGTQAEYGLRQSDPEEMRQTFRGLLRSIGSTQRLANQMLALSRAEAANGLIQERSPVDLAALARDAASDLGLLAVRKGVDLGFSAPPDPCTISGNGPMLQEMIANVIDNAIRYTPAGGHVDVRVAPADGAVNVEIADDGPGIPAAERERVFHRFYRILGQGDSEGSGLGLAIVREICTAHGGTIALGDGAAGRGLKVTLQLPTA